MQDTVGMLAADHLGERLDRGGIFQPSKPVRELRPARQSSDGVSGLGKVICHAEPKKSVTARDQPAHLRRKRSRSASVAHRNCNPVAQCSVSSRDKAKSAILQGIRPYLIEIWMQWMRNIIKDDCSPLRDLRQHA